MIYLIKGLMGFFEKSGGPTSKQAGRVYGGNAGLAFARDERADHYSGTLKF
jgi:hypothetical protein